MLFVDYLLRVNLAAIMVFYEPFNSDTWFTERFALFSVIVARRCSLFTALSMWSASHCITILLAKHKNPSLNSHSIDLAGGVSLDSFSLRIRCAQFYPKMITAGQYSANIFTWLKLISLVSCLDIGCIYDSSAMSNGHRACRVLSVWRLCEGGRRAGPYSQWRHQCGWRHILLRLRPASRQRCE